MELSIDVLGLLFLASTLAGFIDAIAGGGGLITIPALLMTGMSPTMVLGTNKLQGCGGSFSASFYFWRKRAVNFREIRGVVLMTFIGAVFGATVVQFIDVSVIKKVLPFLVAAVGLYFLFAPKLGDEDRIKRISYRTFAFSAALGIGCYDGFFGPATGSMLSLAFVVLLGFNFVKATAHAKILNFTSNIAALIVFAIGGQVMWSIGFLMMFGQMLGGNLGAKMVLLKGKKFIRPMVVIMSLMMTFKMAYEQGYLG